MPTPPPPNASTARSVPLPVVAPTRTIRGSRAGRWRAAVLIGVHVLIAAHVAQWLATGTSLSPLEPSEGMEFSKHGIVNAGLIFFALMIVTTLVLGRWFCGWACHLVALQDLCRWLLKRGGMRPKPARLGVLAVVPLVAFVYMFLGPVLHRIRLGDDLSYRGLELTTDAFWATFPPWIPAILTFLTCGFLIVYLLGSKAFCTYGCPYGGILGVVDQLAPGRIRVNDDCDGSGHCTGACSSNVRVHEEVRDFGMVVDPGCMKCLDCVSVCPNDALSFGVGRPAVLAERRDGATAGRGDGVARGRPETLGRWALLALFMVALFALLTGYDGDFAWWHTGAMAGGTLLVAALFAGRSRRLRGYPLLEQALLAAAFLAALFIFRGLYGVPLLFALGIAAIVAYLVVTLIALAYRPNLHLHRWRLKRHGRWQRAALAFVALMTPLLAFAAHGATFQYYAWSARRLLARASGFPAGAALSPDGLETLRSAEHHAERAADVALGRPAWTDTTLARLALIRGDLDAYERRLADAVEARPDDPGPAIELGDFLASRGRVDEAIELYRRAGERRPRDPAPSIHRGRLYAELGRPAEARAAFEEALERDPRSSLALFNLGVVSVMEGRLDEAIGSFRRAVELRPSYLEARENLAGALCQAGRFEEGIAEFEIALEQNPDDPITHELVAQAHIALGQAEPARRHLLRAAELMRALAEATDDPEIAEAWRQRAAAAESRAGAP